MPTAAARAPRSGTVSPARTVRPALRPEPRIDEGPAPPPGAAGLQPAHSRHRPPRPSALPTRIRGWCGMSSAPSCPSLPSPWRCRPDARRVAAVRHRRPGRGPSVIQRRRYSASTCQRVMSPSATSADHRAGPQSSATEHDDRPTTDTVDPSTGERLEVVAVVGKRCEERAPRLEARDLAGNDVARDGIRLTLSLPEHVMTVLDSWAASDLQATPEEVLEAMADALCTNEDLRAYAAEILKA